MSRADWCQQTGLWDNVPTAESAARGFGPGGVRTEKIRGLVSIVGRPALDPFDVKRILMYREIAEMLLADVV